MFRRKKRITLLNKEWGILKPLLKVEVVPRQNELIYFILENTYYRVMNVVHNLGQKHGIFVIVEKVDNSEIKK